MSRSSCWQSRHVGRLAGNAHRTAQDARQRVGGVGVMVSYGWTHPERLERQEKRGGNERDQASLYSSSRGAQVRK